MLNKFRSKGLKLEKQKVGEEDPAILEPSYCHACGQKTPNRSTFDSFLSSRGDGSSLHSFPGSDSGYGSFISSGSQSSASQTGDAQSLRSIPPPPILPPPRRQATYSSSVYSSDDPALEPLEPFPVVVEDYDEYELDLPPRTLSNYSTSFQPRKSRFSKLNEFPAASPRSLLFPEDVYDLDAGIERNEVKMEDSRPKRSIWHKASLSAVILPSQLRRLSLSNLKKH